MRLGLALVLGVLLAGEAAHADEEAEGGTHRSWSHKGQVGIHAQVGQGYRFIAPYGEEYCGTSGSVCTAAPPPFLDLGISYAPTRSLELLVEMRLGITTDFKPQRAGSDSPRPFVFAPGIKYYVDDSGSAKIFSTLQVSFDRTDYSASGAATSTDVGVRNVNGVLLDVHRTFGIYLHVGMTLGFVRWMRFEVDGGLGIQARFP
jgi:hypothetical protein